MKESNAPGEAKHWSPSKRWSKRVSQLSRILRQYKGSKDEHPARPPSSFEFNCATQQHSPTISVPVRLRSSNVEPGAQAHSRADHYNSSLERPASLRPAEHTELNVKKARPVPIPKRGCSQNGNAASHFSNIPHSCERSPSLWNWRPISLVETEIEDDFFSQSPYGLEIIDRDIGLAPLPSIESTIELPPPVRHSVNNQFVSTEPALRTHNRNRSNDKGYEQGITRDSTGFLNANSRNSTPIPAPRLRSSVRKSVTQTPDYRTAQYQPSSSEESSSLADSPTTVSSSSSISLTADPIEIGDSTVPPNPSYSASGSPKVRDFTQSVAAYRNRMSHYKAPPRDSSYAVRQPISYASNEPRRYSLRHSIQCPDKLTFRARTNTRTNATGRDAVSLTKKAEPNQYRELVLLSDSSVRSRRGGKLLQNDHRIAGLPRLLPVHQNAS